MTQAGRRRGRWPRAARGAFVVAAIALALPVGAAASHLDGFVFTFATPTSSQEGWTLGGEEIDRSDTSVWSDRYLGTFGEETVRLSGIDYLGPAALPPGRAYLSFDLILTGDWGGNGVYDAPDIPDFESFFSVVANGQTLLDTTFSTETGLFGAYQAHPGSFPQDSFPGRTGSVFHPDATFLTVWRLDLEFQLTPVFPNCCTDVDIAFSARFGPGYEGSQFVPPPKWGLDNVVVSSTPIPEPASGALLGLGLAVLGERRTRRRRVQSASGGASTRAPLRTVVSLTTTETERPPLASS